MNVIGLNDIALRSLATQYTHGNFNFGAQLYLFKGAVPETFAETNLKDLTGTIQEINQKLFLECDAVTNVLPTVTRVGNNIQLKISNGTFCFSREKGIWSKPIATEGCYDRQAAAWQTLGDCIIYYPYGAAGANGSTPGLAAILSDSQICAALNTLWDFGCLAAKNWQTLNTGWALQLGRRTNGGNSYAGAGNVVFKEPVEADHVILLMAETGDASASQSLAYIQFLDINNVWQTVPSSALTISANSRYRFNFTKQFIKALRYGGSTTTQADRSSLYYLKQFTAGLRDYASSPMFDTSALDPYTWAILMPEMDLTTRASTKRAPLLLCSVGEIGSGADIELTGTYNYFLPDDLINPNKIILQANI